MVNIDEIISINSSVRNSLFTIENIRQDLLKVKFNSQKQNNKLKSIIDKQIKTCIADLCLLSEQLYQIGNCIEKGDIDFLIANSMEFTDAESNN